MREVFLSHANRDHAQAAKLRKFLISNGVPVWFSSHHLRGAQRWHDEIGAALARCDWFIVMLTPHSVKSMWVNREVKYALIEKRLEDRIIPLIFKKCNVQSLSWTLPQYQMIDFTRDYSKACQQLLRIWKINPSKSRPRRKPKTR